MENPETRHAVSMPWLISWQGLVLMGIVTLAALGTSTAEVALLGGILLVVGVLARLSARWAPDRLRYSRRLSSPRVFRGDTVTLETSLGNGKLLPLTWVEVWERLPMALEVDEPVERSFNDPSTGWLAQGATLGPYQRARWRHQLSCTHRGVFALDRTVVRTGDPFSLIEQDTPLGEPLELVVYPAVVPLRQLALTPRTATLEVAARTSMVTDPTRTVTLRPYVPGDPPRLIHWATTARRGELQVRVPEPTSSLHVQLMVDLHGFFLLRSEAEPLLELLLSAVASAAVHLEEHGATSGLLVSSDPPTLVPPGSGSAHLEGLLNVLARLQPVPTSPLLPWALAHLRPGSRVMLFAAETCPSLATTASQLERAGFPSQVVLAAREGTPFFGLGSSVLRLSLDRDLAAALEGSA